MTAANSTEESYACYFVPTLETYVADCFSINWIKDTEVADTAHETLQQQYENVKSKTNESHVTQYGQLVRVL